jgi:hypothetical protein
MAAASIAEQVASLLGPYLGEFNARISVKTFAQRTLKRELDAIGPEDVPALLEALRPSLYTLVGRLSTDALLDEIRSKVK